MADNILKKQLDRIGKDFLRDIYTGATRPMWGAPTYLFGKVTTGKSTPVTDIARPLRADSSRAMAACSARKSASKTTPYTPETASRKVFARFGGRRKFF